MDMMFSFAMNHAIAPQKGANAVFVGNLAENFKNLF
jgi:hypothetical protein